MAAKEYTNLNLDTVKLTNRINTLDGYIKSLENLISDYENKKTEIARIWTDERVKNYQETIENNIKVCRQALADANRSRTQLQNTVNNMQATMTNVSSAVDKAKNFAAQLLTE